VEGFPPVASATIACQDGPELLVIRPAKETRESGSQTCPKVGPSITDALTGGILMALDPTTPRSRRALLTAAAGGAAAVAASAAAPASVFAVPGAVLTETANASTAETSLSMTSATATDVTLKIATTTTTAASFLAAAGDQTGIATDTGFTGIYGWTEGAPVSDPNHIGSGVWGDSVDIGVVGTGTVGVEGDGFIGVFGAGANDPTAIGMLATGFDGTGNFIALDVRGKAKFSRSGRASIGAGKSTIKINLAGVSFSSLVFAVLRSNRTNRFVRAVVPTTGSFTIYLNAAVTSSSYVVWFVVN
jgi:hypothetical protein